MILTAGPSITEKEIEYVLDAVKNGWNFHHGDYIGRLEKGFSRYIEKKYAMATSSCTGALHLALLSLGIKKGDEVILPDMTWIAPASAVVYTGAKPVFVDIEEDTWVLDPESVVKAITARTRAIIPVHLYGHPVDMDRILQIAGSYNLKVIEDAAPSLGASYKGKKTGSFGHFSTFSFQGAKIMVTGEGGMLLSDDENLMKRARILGDHGRDETIQLWNNEIGYKYKMSNIQAALGLAQLERIDELIKKKRLIHSWYRKRLGGIEGLNLNAERTYAGNNYWMTSITLGEDHKVTRDELREKLYKRGIDTRPFFFPLSSMPMFSDLSYVNPVAEKVSKMGLNLPGGHNLSEKEVDYVCRTIKDILRVAK